MAENGGQGHVCIHEELLRDHERRLGTLENDLKDDIKDIKGDMKDMKTDVSNLRNDLNLNKQQNGYQDKDIEQLKKEDNKKQEDQYNTLKSILGRIGLFGSGVLATLITYFLLH